MFQENNKFTEGKESIHNHAHDHHHHNHQQLSNSKVVFIAFLLTFFFMFVELVGGIISKSLALISDAGHMLSDSTSLILSFIAILLGKKSANSLNTFGYKRVETISAFVNGLILLFVSLLILNEAISRIIHPEMVNSGQMTVIASLGLIINLTVAFILFKNAKENLNIRGAFLHVLGDLLGSIGAIFAALIINFTGWLRVDPLVSIFISLLIIFSASELLKESFHLLMEGVPKNIKMEDVTKVILNQEGVNSVHDLHIWSLGDAKVMLTGHIVITEIIASEQIIKSIKA